MDLAVMGMMRSGTTLVADLLTVPGRSLVLNEPYLLDRWSPELQERLLAIYRGFGLRAPAAPPPAGRYALNQDHFVTEILPQLRQSGCRWGAKYADLHSWRRTFRAYRPHRLVIVVRDLRAVFLSGLELLNRSAVLFGDRRHRRDEAWLFAFIASTVHELMALRREPHLALRYEDLVRDASARDRLARYAGLERLGAGRLNLERHGEERAAWERAKHGDAITERSLRRFEDEPPGPMRAHAERLWRMFPEYGEAFGFEAPVLQVRAPGFQARPDEAANPIDYKRLGNWRWAGPAALEPVFGTRRARVICAAFVKTPRRVLELGAGTAAFGAMLPAGSAHLAADTTARGTRWLVADLARGELPARPRVELVAALGLLEFVADLPRLIAGLARYALPVIASYYAADDTGELDRSAFGWRNHLTRDGLGRMVRAEGFALAARWAVDGRQSILRLEPAPAGRPSDGTPRE
jgi:Sulfotransferase family